MEFHLQDFCPPATLTPSHPPLGRRGPGAVGHAWPLTMFRLEEDIFSAEEKAPLNPKLTWQDGAGGVKGLDSPVSRESPSSESPEVRSRIGSDPPLPEPEVPDEVGTFRARSRSAPPILWAAQRYGRELRRMSDEFHGALQNLPRPKSAGTAVQMHRASGWKETLQSWWHPRSPNDGAPRSPP